MPSDQDHARQLGSLERACPVRTAIGVIAGKWKPAILRAVHEDKVRYVDIRAAVAGITDQALTRHLRELAADGVLQRAPEGPTYRLTPDGERLAGIMDALELWGEIYLDRRNGKTT